MFRKLTIFERIVAMMVAALLTLSAILIWTWSATSGIEGDTQRARAVGLEQALLAKGMQEDVVQVQQWLTDISATRGLDGLDDGFTQAEANTKGFTAKLTTLKALLAATGDGAGQATLTTIAQRFDTYYQAGRAMARAYVEQGPAAGNPLMGPFDQQASELQKVLTPFVDGRVQRAKGLLEGVVVNLSGFRNSILGIILAGLAILLVGGGWLALTIRTALTGIGATVEGMAKGDLTQRVQDLGERNELASVAQTVNALGTRLERVTRSMNLHAGSVTACASELVKIRDQAVADARATRTIVEEVSEENSRLGLEISSVKLAIAQATDNLQHISTAATQLSSNITTIASGAEQASANINTMASAAEEITANIAGVHTSLEQVNRSVGKVANAIQEMNASLREVRNRCELASQESDRASRQAQGTRQVMEKLAEAAREIGNVVELINSITDQTNMLALNAAIEAAGAGPAGKGFAVVANEVKELARQTGEATRLIGEQVEAIQDNTQDVFSAVEEIANVIGAINRANQEILHAVDEQSAATNGIARSMDDVTAAAEEVTRNASELGMAASDVARAAHEAALGTADVARSASEGAFAAEDVANQSQSALSFASEILKSAGTTEEASHKVLERMTEADRIVGLMQGSAAQFQHLGTALQNMTNALYASLTEIDAGTPPFNIRKAKYDHFLIQSLLEQALHGRITPDPKSLNSAKECFFGSWLEGKGGQQFGHSPAFPRVQELHGRLHTHADQLLGAILQGRRDPKDLEEFLSLQRELFLAMDRLYLVGLESEQEFFPWDDKLLTHVKFIDHDHKRLVEMVNQFHRAMLEGSGRDAIGAIINGLVEYTVEHFGREETLMKKLNYPDYPEHKIKHDKLVATVAKLGDEFMAGHFAVGVELLFIARTWLVEHIMGTDQVMAPFLRSHGES